MPARVAEIFSSVQGEGLLVGCRQVFLRMAGCNIHCAFCDTRLDGEAKSCRVEDQPGQGSFRELPNPLTAAQVAAIIEKFNLAQHHSVSFTGGEPLLQVSFIKELAPLLQGRARQGLYLETNGTLPDALEEVGHLFDLVGMDVKLPSVSGLPAFWPEHRRFLEIAARRRVFVKAVVGEDTTENELKQTAELIQACDRRITLILQPVTPLATGPRAITPAKALGLQQLALELLDRVLLIPQTHKLMGQR